MCQAVQVCSTFLFCLSIPKMTRGCGMLWYFFGTCHGKGKHDGVGVVAKQALRSKQLNLDGLLMQKAKDVQFLQATKTTCVVFS
jgi:hypothetical protein